MTDNLIIGQIDGKIGRVRREAKKQRQARSRDIKSNKMSMSDEDYELYHPSNLQLLSSNIMAMSSMKPDLNTITNPPIDDNNFIVAPMTADV